MHHKHLTDAYHRIAKNVERENTKGGTVFSGHEKIELGGVPEWTIAGEFKKREEEAKKAVRV